MTSTLASEGAVSAAPRQIQRRWVKSVGRIGIASRGTIYAILAYLALDIARHGSAPAQTSSTGALQELDSRTGGRLLLIGLTIGLACYAGWRLINAIAGSKSGIKRLSSILVGIVYAGLCARAIELLAGHPPSGGASSNPEPWVSKIMHWTGGSVTIEVAGAILIGAGLGLGAYGLFRQYDKDLALELLSHRMKMVVTLLGGVGEVARGFLLGLVGVYLIQAAITSDASRAKSIDGALRALVVNPLGAFAIALVALGLLAFAIFSFFDARLRRL